MPNYRIPKFGPAADHTFNRSRFLDGTYPTYFAPGQDAGTVNTYENPTDWRPSGGILTPPQVVWLTVCAIDALEDSYQEQFTNGIYFLGFSHTATPVRTTQTYYFNDGNSITVVSQDGVTQSPPNSKYYFLSSAGTGHVRGDSTDPPSGSLSPASAAGEADLLDWWRNTCIPQMQLVYSQAVQNLMAIQRRRLMDLFAEVARTIQSIRPGKTWVIINDVSEANEQGIPFFDPCASYSIAPDSTKGPFFGTDFLQVHALAFSLSGLPPLDQGVLPAAYLDFFNGQLLGSYSKFMRYECWLYGPDGDYSLFPPPPQIPVTPAPIPGGGDTTVIDRINSARRVTIDAINSQLQTRNPGVNTTLQSQAEALASVGVAYKGTQSALSSADVLAAMIADHFGFDPDTGKDL